MKRDPEARRAAARERKAKSRRLALDGKLVVPVLIDIAQTELLISLGLLPRYRDIERSDIADAISVLLRSVTRDT